MSTGQDTPHPYRWVVLFGVWLIYFSFGLCIASMAPLVKEIRADLSISNSTIDAMHSPNEK